MASPPFQQPVQPEWVAPLGSGAVEAALPELSWLAGHMNQVVWLADLSSGRVLYVSEGFEALWGVDGKKLLSQPLLWHEAVLPSDRGKLPRPFFAEKDLGPALHHIERRYRIASGHGEPRWVRDRRFIRTNAQGGSRSVLGLVDMLHEGEEDPVPPPASSSAQGPASPRSHDRSLTSLLAHDLRSPLSAMRGWTHILQRSGELSAIQNQALQGIERCIGTQSQLISAVLDGQLLQSGKVSLSLEEVQVSQLLDQAVQLTAEAARQKHIHLDVSHEALDQRFRVDVERLRQALARLIGDAIRSTPRDAAVRICSRLTAQTTLLEIGDQSDHPPALEPDLNVHLAQQTIELHGGELRQESSPAHHGRLRIVTLPLCTAERPA